MDYDKESEEKKLDARPIGTKLAGFARFSEYGSCMCGHCIHFEADEGACNHPVVMCDPELSKNDEGEAIVTARDYCDYFRPPQPTHTLTIIGINLANGGKAKK